MGASSAHGEAASEFVDFLLSTDGVERTTIANGAASRPLSPAYPTISANVSRAFAAVLDGGDPQQALTLAAEAIDVDLEVDGVY